MELHFEWPTVNMEMPVPRLAERLTAEFGKGFDERNLRHMRAFFQAFPIWDALRSELSWTHYRILLRKVTVDVFFARDNFWLTQRTMADLFGVKPPAVPKHLKNIYASGELNQEATISKMETVQIEGGRQIVREVDFYNLDAVRKKH